MPFGNIHPLFLVLILAIVLIVFGPGKLPEVGGAIGKGIREFRKATAEVTEEITRAVSIEPESAPPTPSAEASESITPAVTTTPPQREPDLPS